MSLTVYSSSKKLPHVSHCLLWLLAVSYRLWNCHRVAACLSLSLPVPWSCFMSLTVSYVFWLSLTVSTIAMDLLHVSHCLFQFHGVAACLSLSPIVAGCL